MVLASQDKPFLPLELTAKLAVLRDLGFDALEADGSLVLNRLDELRRARDKSGLGISSVCGGYRGWIGHFDEARRLECVEDVTTILGRLKSLGASGIVLPAAWGMFSLRLPPMSPPRDSEGDRAALLDSLSRLEEAAEKGGSFVYLEPLNRYEDHMINLLETAAEIIASGGFRRVRICADFFHMNIEEAHIEESLAARIGLLGHVHLADSHRYQPGDGHLDFRPGLSTLHGLGYDGCFTVECRVRGADPLAAYAASVRCLRGLFSQAGYQG